jgi:HEAT repeat protein
MTVNSYLRMLKTGDPRQIREAAEALARIGPTALQAVPALVRVVLQSGGSSNRSGLAACAGEALARMGPGAVPGLLKGLASPRLGVDAEDVLREALGRHGPAAMPFLLAGLRATSLPAKVRDEVLGLIEGLGDAAVPALARALATARGQYFATVATLLGDRGPAARQAVPTLRKVVRSRSPERRRQAEEALARIAGPPPRSQRARNPHPDP